MLRLYAGRENIDKERFIYDTVREIGGETLVLVPNQYTLAAEEQALKYLEDDCLFDVEILSMNRLGFRVLAERGEESVRMLDKYGRFMLLSKIIRDNSEKFEIFRRAAGKMGFTSMLNDFISEFKQQNCSKEQLTAMLSDAEEYPLLKSKISELSGVMEEYEAAIKGKYTDPEDYISMFVDAMGDSLTVKGKSIWIYGYDSITPKFTNAMLVMAAEAEVNFVLNRNDFGLDGRLEAMLGQRAKERGIDFSLEEIPLSYEAAKSETVKRIERCLWSDEVSEGTTNEEFLPEDLTLVCASNPYYEAESAAAYAWHLIRDLGYRMRDIQVIANDEGSMQPIVRRVFAEYGLPIFSDATRGITDTAAVAFIINMLRFDAYRGSSNYLFSMLKTGMSPFDDADIEELENYAGTYRIKGTMWDRDFKYGAADIGDEKFAELNEMRARISASFARLDHLTHPAKTKAKSKTGSDTANCINTREFVESFKTYLNEEWNLSESLDEAAQAAEDAGLFDEAQRLLQSYDKALALLDQISEIMGDEELDLREFIDIYMAGLSDVKVGVIPASMDGLSLGTMIRTRSGPIRALIVLGANEGVLPLQPGTEGLFSIDEKDFFKSKGFALGSLDDIKIDEENAAMYRMMSKPSDKIYISYALSDSSGSDAGPSPVVDELIELFPRIEKDKLIKRDIISEGFGMDMVNTPEDSLRHLSIHLRDGRGGGSLSKDDLTLAMLSWYRSNKKADLDMMIDAIEYDNDPSPLGRELASGLFERGGGELKLSSSAISTYFDCPFKYYVNYGLSPHEENEFTVDPISVGNVYHECLMGVAMKLMDDRSMLKGTEDGDDETLHRLVEEKLDELASKYREGLFVSSGTEKFRMERIREICYMAAESMAEQLSAESLLDASFEESFGKGKEHEPIRIDTKYGEVYVEGKIDRADLLEVQDAKRARVIDYKTGSDSLNIWRMRNGYRMQLMIYMISATSGEAEPAGMFYFNIKDPIVHLGKGTNIDNYNKALSREMKESFKLKGVYIKEDGVSDAMPPSVLANSQKQSLTRDEYEEVKSDVIERIKETAEGIKSGNIGIHPFGESGQKNACSYCSYGSICRKDVSYGKNYTRYLPPEPKKKKK